MRGGKEGKVIKILECEYVEQLRLFDNDCILDSAVRNGVLRHNGTVRSEPLTASLSKLYIRPYRSSSG
jgi:hypothetical protein